jgi:hypothetical protein
MPDRVPNNVLHCAAQQFPVSLESEIELTYDADAAPSRLGVHPAIVNHTAK